MNRGEEMMARPANPSTRTKYEAACRLFEAAADTYRAHARWRLAGEAYARCGEAERKVGGQAELLVAATYYADAGESFERVDTGAAVDAYTRAVGLFATLGRFSAAAALQAHAARLYENDSALEQAAEAFQWAADYYMGDDEYALAAQALASAGECLAREEAFPEAADKFYRAARFAMDDNLLKLKVPALLFSSGLCHVASGDLGAAEARIADAALLDGSFAVGRERRFLLDVVDAARGQSLDDFADHAWNYDHVAQLAPWHLGVLSVLAEMIAAGPVRPRGADEDEEDEGDEDAPPQNEEGGEALR